MLTHIPANVALNQWIQWIQSNNFALLLELKNRILKMGHTNDAFGDKAMNFNDVHEIGLQYQFHCQELAITDSDRHFC